MAKKRVDEIFLYQRVGELFGRIRRILIPGELRMACEANSEFLFEWIVRIADRKFAASFVVSDRELMFEDLDLLAHKLAKPWDEKYCETVQKKSIKEH